MKIRTEPVYIATGRQGEKVIHPGAYARLIFQDGSYQSGDVEAITGESVTISRSDGEYTYRWKELNDIII